MLVSAGQTGTNETEHTMRNLLPILLPILIPLLIGAALGYLRTRESRYVTIHSTDVDADGVVTTSTIRVRRPEGMVL